MEILLVSDVDQAIEQAFLRWLIGKGYRVTVMYSLAQGLEHLSEKTVDVLIIRQGTQACCDETTVGLMRQLNDQCGTAMKVFLSTCYKIESAEAGVNGAGFDHVLFLPMKVERFSAILAELESKE